MKKNPRKNKLYLVGYIGDNQLVYGNATINTERYCDSCRPMTFLQAVSRKQQFNRDLPPKHDKKDEYILIKITEVLPKDY